LWQPDEISAPVDGPAAPAGAPALAVASVRRRTGFGPAFWLSAGWIVVIVLSALLAPVLPIPSASVANPFRRLLHPGSAGHLLGTDDIGRDMLSRVVYGSRVSLVVGASSLVIGLVVGGSIGMIGGFVRGRIERLIMWAVDVVLSFPALVLLAAVVAFVGHSLTTIALILGFLSIPIYARLARAHTLAVGGREFVLAAQAIGASRTRILRREILPSVVPSLLSYGLIAVAIVIVVEGSLSFLGLSVSAPIPSWGGIIAEGQPFLSQDPWLVVVPSIIMCLTVLALNLAGDTLRRRYESTGAKG
jgi:peptide/nickel transport system permease protein